MTVAVLIPNRKDGGRRDTVRRWTCQRLTNLHPAFTQHIGTHEASEGPFNRSAAINRAAAQAPDEADIFVVADSDSFVFPDQLNAAVETARASRQITFAYERFAYLNRSMSDRIMAGDQGNWWPGVEWTLQGTCSSMVIVPRALFERVGGFDEGFTGWGFEDVGFSLACQAVGDGMRRVAGEVWHLHHPVSPENHHESPFYRLNVARMERYQEPDYDAGKMLTLLAELRAETP